MSGGVRARFYVAETTEYNGGLSGKVILRAVSRGDQNKQWSQATPAGTIELTISNLPAFERLREIQRANLDVDVLLAPVVVAHPNDGHPFRQSEGDPSAWYGRQGLCGDCGHMRVDESAAAEKVTHKADRDAGWSPDTGSN